MGILTLFRKPKQPEPLSVATVQSTALAVPGGARESVLAKHGVSSLLGVGMTIAGNLESERGAAIDGTVNGDVTVREQNSALLIRASAVVRGVVRAPIVMVSGTVEGGIEARFVRLFPGSKVIGHIHATRLVVDDGANIVNDDVGTGRVLEHALPPPAAVLEPAQPPVVLKPAQAPAREGWLGAPSQFAGPPRPSMSMNTASFLRQPATARQ